MDNNADIPTLRKVLHNATVGWTSRESQRMDGEPKVDTGKNVVKFPPSGGVRQSKFPQIIYRQPQESMMSKYRKKPVVIDAWRFTGLDTVASMPTWAMGHTQDRAGSTSLFVDTLEGVMEAREGDWIIRGIKGEIYPCKPDIFAATYDPA